MAERTFSEAEIRALIERASQLQASQDQRPDFGLTIAELEQVAADSGIEPSFLRAAVREAETGVGLRDVHGHTDTHVFVERVVPGTLTDEEWHDVVMRLRSEFSSDTAAAFGGSAIQTQGVTEQLGSTREWRHTTMLGIATTVSIQSIDDVQHVRIQRLVGLGSPRAEGIGYGAMAALVAAFIAGGVNQSVWIFALVLIGALLVCAPVIEWLDRKWRNKKLDEIDSVADDIARIVHNDSDPVAGEEALRPALSLEELPDVQDVEIHSTPSTRSRA